MLRKRMIVELLLEDLVLRGRLRRCRRSSCGGSPLGKAGGVVQKMLFMGMMLVDDLRRYCWCSCWGRRTARRRGQRTANRPGDKAVFRLLGRERGRKNSREEELSPVIWGRPRSRRPRSRRTSPKSLCGQRTS